MKNRQEIVTEFLNECSKDLSTAFCERSSEKWVMPDFELLSAAAAATRMRCGDSAIQIRMDYDGSSGTYNGKMIIVICPERYSLERLQSLSYKTNANESSAFEELMLIQKLARERAISFFQGYVFAIMDARKAAKENDESKLRRELEIKSEFEYKRSSRY